MNTFLVETKIKNYRHKVRDLKHRATELSSSEFEQFESARKRFEQRLEAWRKTLTSDLALFESNVEEGYNELEAKVLKVVSQ